MEVFRGCASVWDAYSKWNPFNSGLDYLEERAGSVEVEAMLSRTAPVFNGDIRSHERVTTPLISRFFNRLLADLSSNCLWFCFYNSFVVSTTICFRCTVGVIAFLGFYQILQAAYERQREWFWC
jgi:hypothetical protein